jgi:hypothetical protein
MHSITELAYEEALRLGLPIYVYLADPSTEADDGPNALFPAATRNPDEATQLAAFRTRLSDFNTITYDTFTTPEDLSAKVVTALARRLLYEAQATQRQGPDASGRVLDLVDMPQHGQFVGREQELDDLLLRLRQGDAVGVFTVEGVGGVGKTALAAEAVERLASDERTFPGGALWVACAGLEGDTGLLALFTQVARSLGRADIAALTDLGEVRRALSAALRKRLRTLLTLDNVEPGLDAETALQTLRARTHDAAAHRTRPGGAESGRGHPPRATAQSRGGRALRAAPQARNEWRPPDGGARGGGHTAGRRSGGLPLAVELLAADAGRQGTALAEVRAELAQRGINAAAFRIDPKHTVTQVFDRSWIRLPESQQRLFAGLGLLAEVGFPRAAAEALAVTAGEGDVSTPAPADAVRALVRTGLVEPMRGIRSSIWGRRLRTHWGIRWSLTGWRMPRRIPVSGGMILRGWMRRRRRQRASWARWSGRTSMTAIRGCSIWCMSSTGHGAYAAGAQRSDGFGRGRWRRRERWETRKLCDSCSTNSHSSTGIQAA